GNLHSLLVTSGYLKAVPHGNMYDLSIPNKEVLRSYDGLISRSLGLNRKNQSKLYSYLVSKDSVSTEKELDRLFSPGSIRDEWSHNDYKHALMILFQYMGYDNVTEKESGDGYVDIYVYPTDNQPAVAIEIKITKTSKKLSTLAEEALRQIENRDYIADYNDTIACGMAFNKTKSCVKIR
ncbi:MAG: PD-(D/E)XK nuclease domain-containing protein, partial [Candidatus Methanomethylophilaceae archaeon]